eukprot:Platyproteum_vivax@DN6630_c0_g1_i1.p1
MATQKKPDTQTLIDLLKIKKKELEKENSKREKAEAAYVAAKQEANKLLSQTAITKEVFSRLSLQDESENVNIGLVKLEAMVVNADLLSYMFKGFLQTVFDDKGQAPPDSHTHFQPVEGLSLPALKQAYSLIQASTNQQQKQRTKNHQSERSELEKSIRSHREQIATMERKHNETLEENNNLRKQLEMLRREKAKEFVGRMRVKKIDERDEKVEETYHDAECQTNSERRETECQTDASVYSGNGYKLDVEERSKPWADLKKSRDRTDGGDGLSRSTCSNSSDEETSEEAASPATDCNLRCERAEVESLRQELAQYKNTASSLVNSKDKTIEFLKEKILELEKLQNEDMAMMSLAEKQCQQELLVNKQIKDIQELQEEVDRLNGQMVVKQQREGNLEKQLETLQTDVPNGDYLKNVTLQYMEQVAKGDFTTANTLVPVILTILNVDKEHNIYTTAPNNKNTGGVFSYFSRREV